MKDLGELKFYLGMEVTRSRAERILRLSQQSYIKKILHQYKLTSARSTGTPMAVDTRLSSQQGLPKDGENELFPYREVVGSLMYAATGTRPDIAYAVRVLSQFCGGHSREHHQAAKRVLRYLSGNETLALTYDGREDPLVLGFSDSDWGGCPDTRKSTSAYIFTCGGTAISWASRKQTCVALSSTEAEYVAVAEAAKEAIWLSTVADFLQRPQGPVPLLVDNTGAIALTKNPEFHKRTKHIELKWHFVRDLQEQNRVKIQYCPTEDQLADLLTKPLSKCRHSKLTSQTGLLPTQINKGGG
jgi:hypothetical protein